MSTSVRAPMWMMGSVLRVVALAAALAFLGTFAAPGAQAQEDRSGIEFTISPGPDASTSSGRGWFVLEVEPGERASESVLVRNDSAAPITVHLAAVDADTGPTGGASYRRVDQPVEHVGAWVELERDRLVLEPGEEEMIGFVVSVPPDAVSGVHLAGLAAWVPDPDEQAQENSGGAAAVVEVQRRRVVALQLEVPGAAEPVVNVTGIEPVVRADGVYLHIGMTNEGRGFARGEGVIEIAGTDFRREFVLDTFVPDTSIDYPIRWLDAEDIRTGDFSATVRLDYGMWSEEWEGSFVVGQELIEDLNERGLRGTVIPWLPLGAGAGGAAAGAGLLLLWLRRGRRRNESGQIRTPGKTPPSGWRSEAIPRTDTRTHAEADKR